MAATAGLTYVITVARTGPISAINRKKRRNAIAVQTTASTATEPITARLGTECGHCNAATGAYPTAHSASATPITVTEGTPVR